jgi:predicted ATPase
LGVLETVWRDTRKSGLRWYDAELQRLKGELILSRGRTTGNAEAANCFRRAIAIARSQGALLYELRAAMSLVRLSDGRRNKGNALAALQRAYAGFTEGLHTPDLRAAAEYLRNKTESHRRQTSTA